MLFAFLGIYVLYGVVLLLWFFFGVIGGWAMAFRWVPMFKPWEMPLEFVIETIPHTFVLGFIISAVIAVFSRRNALIVAAIPLVYAFLGVLGFIGYMIFS